MLTVWHWQIGRLPILLVGLNVETTPYRVYERQEPSSEVYSDKSKAKLLKKLEDLAKEVREELERQGFKDDRIVCELYLNLRFVLPLMALEFAILKCNADSKAPIRLS